MRFDGPMIARAWLAVANAAATEKDMPATLFKAVTIEEYLHGARLIATNRFMLLTAFVPDLDNAYDTVEPSFDEQPETTVIVSDPDGRGRGLMGYVLSLAGRFDPDEYVPGMVELSISHGEKLPAGAEPTFEGMDPTFTVLSVPDTEKVYLQVVEAAEAPASHAWRSVVSQHERTSTRSIGINTEFLERIGKVRKHASGILRWSFGGDTKAALIDWPDSDPRVSGAVMPVREHDEAEASDGYDCQTCADGDFCLKHSTGVATVGDLEPAEA